MYRAPGTTNMDGTPRACHETRNEKEECLNGRMANARTVIANTPRLSSHRTTDCCWQWRENEITCVAQGCTETAETELS